MSDSNAFSLVIVQKATGHIDTCVQHLTDGAHDKAKQSSLQAKVLLDLLDSMENHPILKLCSKSLSSVVSAASGRNQDPSEATVSSTTEEYSTNPSLDVAAASPEIRFVDIVGHCAAKDALYENVVLPMLMPEHLKRKVYCGIRANPGNVLLFGLPGTGKTILAQATARESGALFLAVRPSDLLSKYQGESEKYLRAIFSTAKSSSKCIIFFDEFDAIAMSRGGMSSSSRDGEDGAEGGGGSGLCRKLLAELLLQLTECKQLAILSPDSDSTQGPLGTAIEQTPMKPNRNSSSSSVEGAAGSKRSRYSPYTVSPPSPMQQSFSPEADQDGEESYHPLRSAQAAPAAPLPPARPMVVVIAATNRPTDIDPAVLRRFESKINVLPPSQEERAAVFARYLRQVEHSLTAAQLARLAEQTEGWTGCDIENFTREAAMAPVRRAFPMARATDAGGGQDGDRDGDCRERTVAALEASTATVAPITVEDFQTAWENMILRNQY